MPDGLPQGAVHSGALRGWFLLKSMILGHPERPETPIEVPDVELELEGEAKDEIYRQVINKVLVIVMADKLINQFLVVVYQMILHYHRSALSV